MSSAASGEVAAADALAKVPVIRRLEKDVVNRIAAGEVLHRPANALKELLENSLDAGATRISVTLQGGGMKQLRIEDNGCGIRLEDFPILCERFATSKLSSFEDLSRISTFGFRGEALASLTHVAHVAITSKTEDSDYAYKAFFEDGRLVAPPGQSSKEPQPCAGVRGTVIVAEDLFHNIPVRLAALKNHNAEYTRCMNVVMQYAIQFSGVSMSCRQANKNHSDVHTMVGASRKDNIGILYGHDIAKELLTVEHTTKEVGGGFRAEGFVTNANFSAKRFIFVLFINNRLVESASIKKMVDAVYAPLLPKGGHPWVYLSLALPPENLDVNVHPTKKEVHFLYEDEIVDELRQALDRVLEGANSSRVYFTQSVLTAPAPSSSGSASLHRPPSSPHQPLSAPPRLASPSAVVTVPPQSPSPTASSSTAATPRSSLASASKRPEHKVRVHASDQSGLLREFLFHPELAGDLMGDGSIAPPPSASSASSSWLPSPPTPAVSASPPSRAPAPPRATPPAAVGGFVMDTVDDLEDHDDRLPLEPARFDRAGPPQRKRQRFNEASSVQPSSWAPSQFDGEALEGGAADEPNDADQDVVMEPSDEASEANRSGGGRQRLPVGHRDCPPPTNLRGVHALVDQLNAQRHPHLTRLLAEHVYVGRVNEGFCLVQWLSKLYLINLCRLSRSFFYERCLRKFGVAPAVPLIAPANIRVMIQLVLDSPSAHWTPEDGPKEDIADYIVHLLQSKAELLREYFSVDIDAHGMLCGLPQLLPHYVPPVRALPFFLFRLAVDTDWSSEMNCFRDVSNQLARLYMIQHPSLYLDRMEPSESSSSSSAAASSEGAAAIGVASLEDCQEVGQEDQPPRQAASLEWIVRNVFLSHCRSQFSPTSAMASDGTIIQIASLDKLYKVFERC